MRQYFDDRLLQGTEDLQHSGVSYLADILFLESVTDAQWNSRAYSGWSIWAQHKPSAVLFQRCNDDILSFIIPTLFAAWKKHYNHKTKIEFFFMKIICREGQVPSHSLPLRSFALQNLIAVHLSNEHMVTA